MLGSIIEEVKKRLYSELDIETKDSSISEEDLLLAISIRVAHLLDRDSGLLFSYLYRLDISESSLDRVINTPSLDPIAYRIAKLILDRQKKRIMTKKEYNQGPPLQGWEW